MDSILDCTGHKLLIPNMLESKGGYIYDADGRQYMDLASGIWCTSLGHGNKRINNAIKEQVDRIMHTGFCYSAKVVDNAAKLVLSVAEFKGGKCVFLSSGSEAVEILRQASEHLAGACNTLVLSGTELGAYGSLIHREHGWYRFDWHNCQECTDESICELHKQAIDTIPGDITDFMFEPGSAEGFVRFPPKALVQEIVNTVRGNGGKIIVNEVTTGIGRTGTWFGYQHYEIVPDMISIGKGIGNGYPVSVAVFSKDVASALNAFRYSQSHQNEPLGAAVAYEVVRTIQDENLIEKAAQKGNHILSRLKLLESQNIEVRGRGLMYAIDFRNRSDADTVSNSLLEKGYIVGNRGAYLRIDPPLTITDKQLELFLDCLSDSIQALTGRKGQNKGAG